MQSTRKRSVGLGGVQQEEQQQIQATAPAPAAIMKLAITRILQQHPVMISRAVLQPPQPTQALPELLGANTVQIGGRKIAC
jgi:hypothetical protein